MKLIVGVTASILLAAAIIFGTYLALQPRDCALQLLEEHNGSRASYDVDSSCTRYGGGVR